MRTVLRNPAVLSVSLGHMAVDILNSSLPVLLVAFALRMGLSNLELGTVATLYTLAASLTQPLFGLVADRWDDRWLGAGGVLWLASGFVLASFTDGTLAFALLIIASFGSGAFHPHGTMHARRAAGEHAASGTSLFFFFGQTGLAMGPILAGFLLAHLPLQLTILLMSSLALPAILVLARFGPREAREAGRLPPEQASGQGQSRISWTPIAIGAFVLVLFFRGWPPAATNTFLPKWLADAGFTPEQFGSMLGLFMFSSALGNVFGGWLADRWSRKGVVVLPLLLAPVPFYFLYLSPGVGPLALGATVVAGFTMGMPHSVMVLMGQNLFPGRMGFGSGMVLGFMFAVGAAAGWLTGWLGDLIGLQQALQWIPWVCAAGAVAALALPRTRQRASMLSVPAAD